jgi:hypothetical protein
MPLRRILLLSLVASGCLLGCAETAAPPPAPEEVVVVLNTAGATLSLVPVAAPAQISTVPLGASDVEPVSVATRGATAVVPLRARSALAVVDLRQQQLVNTIPLQSGSIVSGAALVDDSVAYVASSNLDLITRVDLSTGDTASLAVGNTPQQVTFTRGRLLVLNANLDSLGKPAGESWISVVGFAPSVDACVIDGVPLSPEGALPFSTRDGGGLCATCAVQRGATQLPDRDRADLVALLDPAAALPVLDVRHKAAHRRLLARYIRYHLGEGANLPALEFWMDRPWEAA